MAKQDILDAINATIVPNGAKAINADSLRNLLTMMTENAGEGGSGDGALRIMVPDYYYSAKDVFIPEGAFNSEMIELFRTEVEGSGMDFEPLFAAWETALSHNAEVYQQLLAKTKANEGTMVVIDQSLPYSIMMKIMFNQQVPGAIEEMYISSGQLGIFNGTYGKMGGEEVDNMGIIPLSNPGMEADDAIYPPSIGMLLKPDGSIEFEVLEEEQPSSGSGVVTFYMLGGGGVQNDTTKAMNKKSYDAFWAYDGLPAVNILANVGESYTKNDGFEAMYPIVVAGAPNENLILQTSEFKFEISSDGNMVFEEHPTSGSGAVTFYVPVDNSELTNEYKAKNAASFSSFRHGVPTTIAAVDGEGPFTTIIPTSILSNDDSILLGALQGTNDGFSISTIKVASDGSVTIQQ